MSPEKKFIPTVLVSKSPEIEKMSPEMFYMRTARRHISPALLHIPPERKNMSPDETKIPPEIDII